MKVSKSSRIIVAATISLLVTGLMWNARKASRSTQQAATEHGLRNPASHNVDADKRRREVDEPTPGHGKVSGGHLISISATNSQGESITLPLDGDFTKYDLVNSRFTLQAKITATRHMAPHDFAWIYPQSYRLIEGTSVGVVPELKAGQVYELQISLDRGTEPEQPVVFHLYKLVNSEPRGTVVQFDFPRMVNSQRAKGQQINHADEKYVQ